MAARARSLVLRMDPSLPETSERIDRVAKKIAGVRSRTRMLSGQIAVLARQFLDDEFLEESGPEQGQPLAREGRIEWLTRLAGLHRSYCAACEEELALQAWMRRMEDSVESLSNEKSHHPAVSGPSATHSPH